MSPMMKERRDLSYLSVVIYCPEGEEIFSSPYGEQRGQPSPFFPKRRTNEM